MSSAAQKRHDDLESKKEKAAEEQKAEDRKHETLDTRVENALTTVIREIDDFAEKRKATARGVAATQQSELTSSDADQVEVVRRLKAAIAKSDMQQFGKVVCPRCGSDSLAVADSSGSPAGAVAQGAVHPGGQILHCNQCGYQPPA